MTRDTLDRLRAADPARELDPQAPEDLLLALTGSPRPAPRRRTLRRARAWVPITAAAAVAATMALMLGGSPELGGPDFAARAYAQVAPDSHEILYVKTSTRRENDGQKVDVSTSEMWERAGVWHSIQRYEDAPSEWIESTLDADGCLHQRADRAIFSGDRTEQTICREDAEHDLRWYIDESRNGFVAHFRRAYERGQLDSSSDTTFNGRPARRYVVTSDGVREEFYVDAETAAPLGSKFVTITSAPNGDDLTHTEVMTVDALDHLPPTPENVEKLDRLRTLSTLATLPTRRRPETRHAKRAAAERDHEMTPATARTGRQRRFDSITRANKRHQYRAT